VANKISKDKAHYQVRPRDGHQCSGCSMYVKPRGEAMFGTCTLVTGSIAPRGWCRYWEASRGASAKPKEEPQGA